MYVYIRKHQQFWCILSVLCSLCSLCCQTHRERKCLTAAVASPLDLGEEDQRQHQDEDIPGTVTARSLCDPATVGCVNPLQPSQLISPLVH